MSTGRAITVTVNGSEHRGYVDVRLTLADFLRRELKLTGTHLGCEHGVCGACTILVEGRSARGCLMLAVQADGLHVSTVEGLASGNDKLNALQQAFSDHHALQCGFCTPGILMSLTELLATQTEPTEADIRDVLSGHICRCTGYQTIVDACLAVVRKATPGIGAAA